MSDDVRAVAYHEAGHVVIAVHHEIAFDFVTIKPDERDER